MNSSCVTCPVVRIAKAIKNTKYSTEEEIAFELYKAQRAREMKSYRPFSKPWSSYPRRRLKPLSAEEVDGEWLLGEM